MADTPMLDLPTASSVDGSEYAWIVQGGTDKRATLQQIANIATGFVPTSRAINTPADSGLSGGGQLTGDLTLGLSVTNLEAKAAMAVADSFAINDVAGGNESKKATFPNAMKALTGLAALAIPSLTADFLIINRASDGETYKISPSALSLAAGNVPAGGTAGQALLKLSGTDYDTIWSAVSVPSGGTGLATVAQGDLLYGSAPDTYALLNKSTTATRYLANTGSSNNPNWDQVNLTNGVTGELPLANGGTNANLTASDGGLVYSTASALAILAGTATANQIPLSGANAAPAWSTAAYPATAAAGTILAAASANSIAATATPTLGVVGSVLGTLTLAGNTSGSALIRPQATAGSPTLTLPNLSGTLAASAAAPITLNATTGEIGITGSALTRVDDTNVTLTLGGTPSSALLAATSLTLGWSGQLGLTRGGSGASLTASNGGIVYSTASALAILTGTATANLPLLSGSSTTPAWAAVAYPTSATSGGVPYFSSTSVMTSSGLLAANGVVLGGGAGATPTTTSAGTDGQVLTGNTAGAPTFQAPTAIIPFIIDGGGATITTGIKGDIGPIPFAFTINQATLLADQTGSIVIDIWADTYANYPPTDADSITASAPPTITTAVKSQDATLTGWTVSFAAGTILRFNVDSVTTIQRVELALQAVKTSA